MEACKAGWLKNSFPFCIEIIYSAFGNKCDRTARIYPHCFVGGSGLTIGSRSFVNCDCFFDLADKITIGSNVHIAMRCVFITSTHKIGGTDERAFDGVHLPITINNGCWIGANSTILPGISVGQGTVIAAGSVVTHSCEPDSLYAGVPAKKIKDLPRDMKFEAMHSK